MQDIVEMGFILPEKYPRDSTFHHFNGYSVSQIDYILPFKHCDFITDIKIHHRESLNTSTHDPVSGKFIIKPYINACQNEEQPINFKLNWKKCDVQNYQKLVTDQITDMDLLSIIDCEEQISKLIKILNNSADKCSKKSKSRSKRSNPWTPEINSLCKLSKRSHWKWRENGTPKNKESIMDGLYYCQKEFTSSSTTGRS